MAAGRIDHESPDTAATGSTVASNTRGQPLLNPRPTALRPSGRPGPEQATVNPVEPLPSAMRLTDAAASSDEAVDALGQQDEALGPAARKTDLLKWSSDGEQQPDRIDIRPGPRLHVSDEPVDLGQRGVAIFP